MVIMITIILIILFQIISTSSWLYKPPGGNESEDIARLVPPPTLLRPGPVARDLWHSLLQESFYLWKRSGEMNCQSKNRNQHISKVLWTWSVRYQLHDKLESNTFQTFQQSLQGLRQNDDQGRYWSRGLSLHSPMSSLTPQVRGSWLKYI